MDEVKRTLWVQKIQREDWIPTEHSSICSDHFLERNIFHAKNRVQQQDDAVLTRYNGFPSHLKGVENSS